MDMNVIAITPLATDVVRIRLASPDGGALPAFKPGAHIELTFAGFTRRYSLTSSPYDTSHYEICVLRTTPGRGGSAYLHDQLSIGDRLNVSGPFNAFPLRMEAMHSVFIAGGIGITPFFSMMAALERASLPFELHYAARSSAHFLPVPEKAKQTHRYTSIGDKHSLDIEAILDTLATDVELYVCGPHGLIEAVRTKAGERGWPEKSVHFESFGSSPKDSDKPLTVHLALSGISMEVQPDTSILDALLAHGVWAPYECKRGECASCMTEVLEGTPDHRDLCLTESQRGKAMCTCVSWAETSEIVLNL